MSNFIVSAEHAVKILNEAFMLDPDGIAGIAGNSSRINEALSNHPTIQTSIAGYADVRSVGLNGEIVNSGELEPIYKLGIIGLLNGIFGCDENGQGPIARLYDISPDGSEVFAGFCINTNLKPDAKPNPANQRHMSDRTGREEIPPFGFGTCMTPNPDKPIMRCG